MHKSLLYITLFILLIAWDAGAQFDSRIDSMKHRLTLDIDDTSKVITYSNLATEIPDEKEWVAYNDSALEFANQKLKSAKGEQRQVYLLAKANALANRGYYWDYHANIEKALENFYSAIDIYKQLDHHIGLATAYSNVGLIFSDNEDWDEARDLLQKSLDLKLEHGGGKADIAVTLINLGFVAEGTGDPEEGERLYMRAAELALMDESWANYATAMNNLATLAHSRGEYKQALNYLRKSLMNYQKVGDVDGVGWAYSNIAQNQLALGMVDSAEVYYDKAYVLAKEIGHPELIEEVTVDMYKLKYQLGEYKQSVEFLEEYIVMKDCLNNVEMQKTALKKKQAHDRKMDQLAHEKEIEKERAISEEKEARRRQQIVFISGGLFLVIVFAVIIFQRLRVTRKQKTIIEDQQERTERQKEIIEEKNTEIVDSITYAKRIQDAILPPPGEMSRILSNHFVLYKPKDIVAGDFYWLEELDKGVLVAAADCTGHGVPGAMVSVICNNAMNRAVREFGLFKPGEVLDKTRELVLEQFEKSETEVKDGMDIALVYLDKKPSEIGNGSSTKVKVLYAGAHNPLWVVKGNRSPLDPTNRGQRPEGIDSNSDWNSDSALIEIKADKQPIGKTDRSTTFTTHELEVEKGSMIYIFSDGYVDQFGGPKGKKLKSSKFKKQLTQIAHLPVEEQHQRLEQSFEDWKGRLEQLDDVCVIGMQL